LIDLVISFPCFSEGKEDPWQTLRKSSEDSPNMDYYNEEEKEIKPLSSSSVKNLNSNLNSKKNINSNNGRKNQNSNQSSGSQGKKRIEKQEEEEEDELEEKLNFYSNENENESNNNNNNYNSKNYHDNDVRENDYDNVGEYDDSYEEKENTSKKSKKSGSGFLGLGRRKESEQ
jgi:hypothetical protein